MLVMRLLAAMTMPNNRITLTDRTQAYHDLVAVVGPARSKLLRPGRCWDKEDRYLERASPSTVTRQDLSGCEAPPPEDNPTEREYSFLPPASNACFRLLAGYRPDIVNADLRRQESIPHPYRGETSLGICYVVKFPVSQHSTCRAISIMASRISLRFSPPVIACHPIPLN